MIFFLTGVMLGVSQFMILKTLYEETVVWDRLTIGVILVAACMDALADKLALPSGIAWGESILTFSGMLFLVLRGEKKCRLRRLWCFFEVLVLQVLMLEIFSMLIMLLLAPDLAVTFMSSDSMRGINWFYLLIILSSFIFFRYLYRNFYRKQIFVQLHRWDRAILLSFELFLFIVVILLCEDTMITTQDVSGVVQFCLLVSLVLLYFLFPLLLVKRRLSETYRQGKEYQEAYMQMELQHFMQYREAQEETSRFRHDSINNLNNISYLLERGQTEEAKAYVKELLGTVQSFSPKVVSGNSILDGIVSAKWEQMMQEQISFSMEGVFDRGLFWPGIDICAVFANGLDNAIEACKMVEKDRYVKLQVRYTRNFYYVELVNSVNPEKSAYRKMKRFTTKKEQKLHGFGMMNMEQTLEKHGGTMEAGIEGATFAVRMYIPVSEP